MLGDHVFNDGGIPHATFSTLRCQSPRLFASLGETEPAWHLFSYADVTSALRNWEQFSSHEGGTTLQDQTPRQVAHNTSLLHTDPPEHTRLRSAFNASMSRARVETMSDQLDTIASKLVTEATAAGTIDVPQGLAARMASYSLCHFLGIPNRHRDTFMRLSALMLADTTPNPPIGRSSPLVGRPGDSALHRGSPSLAMIDLLMTYCFESDRDDGLGRLAQRPTGVGVKEVEDVLLILSTAGTGMTMNAIATMLWQLSIQWDELVSEEGLLLVTSDQLIEESLRFATPLMHTRRTATADLVLNDTLIRAGEKVVLWLASANFDAQAFNDPLCFDPRRATNPHLSFARHSPHFCLGAHLARLEMKAVLNAVIQHCGRLSTAAPPDFLPSNFVNEMVTLRMTFAKRTGL